MVVMLGQISISGAVIMQNNLTIDGGLTVSGDDSVFANCDVQGGNMIASRLIDY
jgi:hypothetical protein